MTRPSSRAAGRTAEVWLFAIVLVTLGYFHGGGGVAPNSRLDAIYAFVEPGTPDTGTFRINHFRANTSDWSRVGDDYFSNKAPGAILLGVPPYAILVALERRLGLPWTHPLVAIANAYAINLFVSVTFVALAAVAGFRLLCRTGVATPRAWWLALALVLCTPLFPYATQLFGHVTSASLAVAAVLAYTGGLPRSLVWAGLLAGAAAITDYLSVLVLVGLLTATAVTHGARGAAWLLLGASIPMLVQVGYGWICFSDPFAIPPLLSNPIYVETDRALGLFGVPSREAAWQLSFGLRRGLFSQVPILALSLLGFGFWFRRARRDPLLWLCAGTGLALFAAVAGFNGWDAGATVAPRYLISVIPLVYLGVKEIPATGPWRFALVAAAAASFCNMLAIAAVNPTAPDDLRNPLYGWTYAKLYAGELSPFYFPIRLFQFHPQLAGFRDWLMWNWGQLLGLRGLASLLPLFALLAAGLAFGRPGRTVTGTGAR